MAASEIQFCDLCRGSIPAGRGAQIPGGGVYCPACYVKLAAVARGAKTSGVKAGEPFPAEPPLKAKTPRVSLPGWSLVTACVGILLLALSIGISVFLFTRLQQLNDRLGRIEQGVADLSKLDQETRAALEAALGRRPGDPDFADDRQLLGEAIKALRGFSEDYRRELDTTLDEIDRGGRVRPRRPPREGRRDTPDAPGR